MAKSTVKKVEYNKEFLSLLNDLCSINESLIVVKDEKANTLKVQRANNAKTIAYRLGMKNDVFNFDGDKIAFYKFAEFFQLLSCFDEPELHQSDSKLTMSKDKSKINYILSDPETLSKSPANIKFENPQVEFQLTSADIKELKKMIGLLVAKNTRFTCSKNKVDITCYNSGHDNSFTKTYDAERQEAEFSFPISSEIFTVIPDGDYTIELMEKVLPNKKVVHMCRFTLQKKDISLEIFTAQINED